jgi:16S rRNA (cytosine967-C5)-methyltransferase
MSRDDKQRDVAGRLDPVRMLAADVLAGVRESDAYANLLLPRLIRERRLNTRDAAFATELTYGTCRALGVLDRVIESASGRPVSEIDGPVLDALRLGAYQLLRTRVGAHAAVSTSVDLVRRRAGHGAVGFANAVLRKISQKDEDLWVDELAPSMADDLLGNLAFRYAHPRWIAEVFHRALGGSMGQLQAALAADDTRPITHLVARPGQIAADELAAITGGDIGRLSPYCVYLDGGDPGALEPVREGLAGVQDEGSQLVARAAAVAPVTGERTDRWLDLCAGPGGKAALLGSLAAIDGATVDAVEPAPHRATLIEQVTADLPVTVHIADGRDSGLTPGYDRVLVDAPCSGLGSLRRRPEARWRRGPADVPGLVELQGELLTAAIGLARSGGIVAYSTCSPHPDETVAVVAAAVERGDVEPVDARALIPNGTDLGDGPWVQLWPHLHGTDAMFLALLRKR